MKGGGWGDGLSKNEKNRKQKNEIWTKIKMIQNVWSSF